jgi:hypothetical protein
MTDGFPAFGCHINQDKTVTNVVVGDDSSRSSRHSGTEISFCGAIFDVGTLQTRGGEIRQLLKE